MADLAFNGNPTILLGTFGQEILAYQEEGERGWQLYWQKSFPAPLLGIRYADLTGDGVKEIIVITTQGVQILQHDLRTVKETAVRRITQIALLLKNV